MAARWEPRRVLVAAGTARLALVGVLAMAIAFGAGPATLVALLFALGAVSTVHYPAVLRLLHDAVSSDRCDRSSAAAAGIESVGFWAGPALGGALLAAGPVWPLATAIVLAAASVALVAVAPVGPAAADRHPSAVPTGRGVGILWSPGRRRSVAVAVALNALAGTLAVLLVPWAHARTDEGDRLFGLLSSASGIGAAAAFGIVLGRARHLPPAAVLAAGVGAVMVLAHTARPAVGFAACVVVGGSVVMSELSATAALGRGTCGQDVAAAAAMLDTWMVAAMTAGAAVAPVLVGAVGHRIALVLVGVVVAGIVSSVPDRSTR